MRKMTGPGRTLAGAGAIALVLAAPTTAATAAPRAGAGHASGATFQVHMTLNGAVRGSLVFKVIELDTPCTGGTGLGSAGDDGVPTPNGEHVKLNGALVQYAINNPSYKGPGTYGTADFASSSAAISADKASESDPFAPANNDSATETLVWEKNGSGTFVFRGWENGNSTRALNGKFSWTCKN